jgi:hypothetical protein
MTAILKVDTIQDTAGNNIINESSDTITIGASGDTISIPSGATIANSGTATGFGIDGITMADQWRLTAHYTWSSPGDLTANLERVDTSPQGNLGTGMSESSGIFTFPSTGYYLVRFSGQQFKNGDRRDIEINIKTTTNNSSYTTVANCKTHITQSASNTTYIQGMTETLLDITDTSNQKVKFNVFTDATTSGDSGNNQTFMTFIRLGDT